MRRRAGTGGDALRAQAGAAAAAELARQTARPGACRSWPVDTADAASIGRLAAEVQARYDRHVVAVVNNAAVMPFGWSARELAQAVRTNVMGPVQLAQRLAPHMRPGGQPLSPPCRRARPAG